MIEKSSKFLGWYLPELKDISTKVGITITTGGSQDVESCDSSFLTQIVQDASINKRPEIPRIIYSGSVEAAVAVHYWCVQAFIRGNQHAESLLRQADYFSDEENQPDLISLTPPDYLKQILSRHK